MLLAVACVPKPADVSDSGPVAEDAEPDAGFSFDARAPDATVPDDTGVPDDSGVAEDAGEMDASLPSQCPTIADPACTSAADCADDIPPPTNCEACVPANDTLCAGATCTMPPTLAIADIYAVATQVDPSVPLLSSVGVFAVASGTAGQRVIGCDDVYSGTVDLTDRCFNVLYSKSINVSQTGDTYTVAFTGFASGQHTLFLIYGFTSVGARGAPVGLSCSEIDVGPPSPGGQTQYFAGDRMRLL